MTDRPTLDELAAQIAAKRQPGTPAKEAHYDRRVLVAALYILGASQYQLATLFGVARGTIKAAIALKLTPLMRGKIRSVGLHKPLLTQEAVAYYRNHYIDHRLEYEGLDPLTLAAKLKALPLED